MNTLSVDKDALIATYNEADKNGKKLLSKLFDKEVFAGKITDRVKTFEDACGILGISTELFNEKDTPDEIAYKKLKVIAQALNEGWVPDWNDEDEYKYYPYFRMGSTGFRFSNVRYGRWDASTCCSSRLCFKSEELAKYCGTHFSAIYKDYLALSA